VIGNFVPYYEGRDAYLYGLGAISFVEGSPEYTVGGFGIFALSAFSYLLGGYYGLFYLGPIATILFLIISERVITKLFGGFAGLVALIFLSTDEALLKNGSTLLTDSIFGLLLILGSFFLIKFLKDKTSTSILLCSSLLSAATFFRLNGVIFLPIEIMLISGYFLFQYFKFGKRNVETLDSSNVNPNLIKQFSKIKIKKILKITFYILVPWLVFFIFLVSTNIYFFDEPFTTYLEQNSRVETGNIISSYLIFDDERFESIMSYSSVFTPGLTYSLVKTISLDEVRLNQFSLSIISFTFLFSALIISLYYKINRKEIIIFISFILGLLLFYSSNTIVSFTGVGLRYMIPTLPFTFGILGYLMYRAWNINHQKISIKYSQIISKSWKVFLIIIFTLLLLSTLYYSNPVEPLIVKQNFEFKNPQDYASRFPLDKEGLTEKSIIVDRNKWHAKEYQVIPLNPFREYNEKTNEWSSDYLKEQSVKKISQLLDEGNDLYVFKYKRLGDPSYYRYLEAEYSIILKEHSKTFCKLILIEDASGANNTQIHSDEICHSFLDRRK